jgi:hypothetical protein
LHRCRLSTATPGEIDTDGKWAGERGVLCTATLKIPIGEEAHMPADAAKSRTGVLQPREVNPDCTEEGGEWRQGGNKEIERKRGREGQGREEGESLRRARDRGEHKTMYSNTPQHQ